MSKSRLAFCLLVLVISLAHPAETERADEKIGCTAIAVDSAASADGSAFAGMNADGDGADFRLTFVPPRQHSEKMRDVFTFNLSYPRWVGYGRGEFFHPDPANHPLSERVGQIPQVERTFGYYESTEPLMNDQGVGLGESSCAAMLVNKFPGDVADTRDVPIGMLDTVTLMQLALERCATARCAVELMGKLSEEFGFVPTPGEPTTGQVYGRTSWDDAGEAYTVADKFGEAWVFHVVGGVKGVTNSVWAAQKVPKGHIAVIANEFIIGDLPEEPTNDVLFNKNIRQAALAAKLWDGKSALHFSKTFSPDPVAFESPVGERPIPLYGALRRWGLYNLAAPSLKLPFHQNNQDYPIFVEVEKKLSHRDVMGYFGYQYQGTEFDMTQGVLAGPFGTPFRLEGGPTSGQVPRGIAIQRCVYSIVIQTGPAKQIGWYAIDTPTTSVYVPLYAQSRVVTPSYASGHHGEFSRESAWWVFNFVNSFMQLNYRDMSQQDVYPAIESMQNDIDEKCRKVEQTSGSVDELQASVQEYVVARWWKLADHLVMKYNDGRVNVPTVGKAVGYPQWWADMIGFSNDVHPTWVQPSSSPSKLVADQLTGYVPSTFQLPLFWDGVTSTWSMKKEPADVFPLSLTSDKASSVPTFVAVQVTVLVMALSVGISLGRSCERRKQSQSEAYMRLA